LEITTTIKVLKICSIVSLILFSSCSTLDYKIDSEPPGADIYRLQDGRYKLYATTPFSEQVMSPLRWTGDSFIAKREGYFDSEPVTAAQTVPGRMFLNFRLKQNDLPILERYLSENSLSQYWYFLQTYPDSLHRKKVYAPMLSLIARQSNAQQSYSRLLRYVEDKETRKIVFGRMIKAIYKSKTPLPGLYALLDQFPDIADYQSDMLSAIVSQIETSKNPVAEYNRLFAEASYSDVFSGESYAQTRADAFNKLIKHVKRSRAPLKGLYAVLEKHPLALQYSSLIFPEMIGLIKQMKNTDSKLSLLSAKYPASNKYLPDRIRLAAIGPAGMRVFEINDLIKNGLGESIITQKILNAGEPYKEFSFSEIESLGKMGLPDKVVAAMLNVTASYNKSILEEKRQQAAQALISQQHEMAEKRRAAAEREYQRQKQSASEKNNETNVPAECLKLVAALKACEQTGGFLSMGCKAIANSSFDCPIPVAKLM